MTIRTVTIPARTEHNGVDAVKVKLDWTCPVCGQPRGEIRDTRSPDGDSILECDGWVNPCGHIDIYAAVRTEAKTNGLNEVQS